MELDVILQKISTIPPTSLAAALAALFITILYFALKGRGLPPGPRGLPYFGYWPFLSNSKCHLELEAVRKKYGNVFSFTSTGRLFINLATIKVIREACVSKSECFGDRMTSFNLLTSMFGDGVLGLNGEAWRNVRKFFLVQLKERSTKSIKTSLSGNLYESINSTINDLKAKKGEPVNIIEILTHKCNAILRLTVFGDVGATEEQVRRFNELYAVSISTILPKTMLLTGTFAKYFLFPFMPNFSAAEKCLKEQTKLLYEIINEHKATYDENNLRDIIDDYYHEKDKRTKKGDPTAKYFTDECLAGTLAQFVGDGVLSVAAFVSLLMKTLLEYPEEQEKVYKEIVSVIGTDRHPTIEDKSQLTYFNAYLMESLRKGEFFNFFPSQECTKETTVSGYRIPKGAILLVNFYSAHNDPNIYEEPEKFNPSRFIQKEGKQRADLPISFGIGKRACLGEGYTMMQVFLLITTIIQNFQLSLPEGAESKHALEEFNASSLLMCAKPRDHK
ncbi:cytochrome P450 18a1 [Caerostris darwini]|uniref:Cytochrome P450 18a1 n=1 Tax=Caerostris darwini TaxID=1538125 RepID=A0AAV4S5P1_9ARAC|nr:cytochrome P450 18a1 [Caerostris darwini]